MSNSIKKDNLNRIVYNNINDYERYITKYYENTNQKKIIIKLLGNHQNIIILARSGDVIYSDEQSDFFNFEVIKFYNKKIEIKLPIETKNEYLKILKNLIKNNNK